MFYNLLFYIIEVHVVVRNGSGYGLFRMDCSSLGRSQSSLFVQVTYCLNVDMSGSLCTQGMELKWYHVVSVLPHFVRLLL